MSLQKLRLPFSVISIHWPVCVSLIAAGLPFLWPIPWANTPDGVLHLQRTRALAEALQAGVFYPRLFPDFAFDYGYPVLNYYAPLAYYPAALFHLVGLPIESAMGIALVLFSALAAWASYQFLRCWTGAWIALVGTCCYLFFPYRLYDLFIRGALPEFVAFTWLPVIGFGLYKLRQQAHGASALRDLIQSKALVVTLLGWSALLLTHNLSALLALLTAGGTFSLLLLSGKIAGIDKLHKAIRAVVVFTLPIILGGSLAAFYILPALLEMKWVGIGQGLNTHGYAHHFAPFFNLFSWSFPYAYPSAAAPTVPIPGAVAVILFLLLLPCLADRTGRLRGVASLVLLISIGTLWLLTEASHPLWAMATPVLGKLLFPWRWQVILTFAVAWGIALIFQWVQENYCPRPTTVGRLVTGGVVVGVGIYSLAALPQPETTLSSRLLTRQAMWEFDAAMGQLGTGWLGEFTPVWVEEQRWAISRAPTSGTMTNQPPIAQDNLPRLGADSPRITPLRDGYLTDTFQAEVTTPTRLIFHTFFWPAWRIYANEQALPAFPVSNLGLLAVDLPAGQYVLTLRWLPTPAARIGWLITSIAWGGMLLLLLTRPKAHRDWLGGWLLLGLVSVVALLWSPQDIVPTEVAADFGPPAGQPEVHLAATYAAPACIGTVAQIELYWLIAAPQQPLTAFVHVLGTDSQVKTQHDGPLAGDYTPFERWLPGMMIKRQHPVPIPADLAPGVYTIMAGVYLSADPTTVLVPLRVGKQHVTGSSHRVASGTLEVKECQ